MTQITLPASFENITHRKDGSSKLSFETRELTGEEIMLLLGFRNSEGWLMFSQNKEFKVPEMEAELDLKSPSERLRNALYVLYKDEPRVSTFQTYYNENMEKLINIILGKVKSKL